VQSDRCQKADRDAQLGFITFGYKNDINGRLGGNRYTGTYTIFLPLSRRFEVQFDVPFVVSNGSKDRHRGYISAFGELMVNPRFLLSETAATAQVFALAVCTPTGSPATATGNAALTPRYEFWTNPFGPSPTVKPAKPNAKPAKSGVSAGARAAGSPG
jgi:hypothetical protein